MIFALAIAVGVLTAAGTVPAAASAGVMFFGELGLDGRLRPVRGVLPAVAAAAEDGRFGTVLVAEQNAPEAALVPGVRVIAASTLTAVIDWLRGTPGSRGGPPAAEFARGQEPPAVPSSWPAPDLADVLGQPLAKASSRDLRGGRSSPHASRAPRGQARRCSGGAFRAVHAASGAHGGSLR